MRLHSSALSEVCTGPIGVLFLLFPVPQARGRRAGGRQARGQAGERESEGGEVAMNTKWRIKRRRREKLSRKTDGRADGWTIESARRRRRRRRRPFCHQACYDTAAKASSLLLLLLLLLLCVPSCFCPLRAWRRRRAEDGRVGKGWREWRNFSRIAELCFESDPLFYLNIRLSVLQS